MEKIDFAKVKAGVPIDAVLQQYGIQTRKVNNSYLRCDCPLPSHTSKESKNSFAVNIEKNIWCCQSDSCKAGSGKKGGDVIDLVMLMDGLRSPIDAAKKLVEWFPEYEVPKPVEVPAPQENKPLALCWLAGRTTFALVLSAKLITR